MSRTILGVLAIIALVLVGFALLVREDVTVGLHQEIQYDDFAFSVLGTRATSSEPSIGRPPAAGKTFFAVNFRVANHAKRVTFDPRNACPVIVGPDGTEYRELPESQSAVPALALRPGETWEKERLFEIPEDHGDLELLVSFGSFGRFLGDILDVLFIGRKSIRLR